MIALVNKTKVGGASGGTTPPVSFVGVSLIVLINSFLGGGEPAKTDIFGNTYLDLTLQSNGAGSGSQRISYVPNPVVGTGFTGTLTGTTTAGIFLGYSGIQVASPFDQENGAVNATGLPISFQAGGVTQGSDGELIVAGFMASAAGEGTVSIGGSFNIEDFIARVGGGVNPGCYAADLVQTTAGAADPAWAFTQGVTVAATLASFKAAAGGGGPATRRRTYIFG